MVASTGKRNAVASPQKTLMAAAVTLLLGSTVVARLLPVTIDPPRYGNATKALDVCRTTVRDVQPFLLVVFACTDHAPDAFMRLAHDTVGTAILLTDDPAAITDHNSMDASVTLMIVDRSDTVAALIDQKPAAWYQLSHYVWLMPQTDRSEATSLFRAAWRQWSVANVVIVTQSTAYTYNPFKDVVREHRTVDAEELRAVTRRKMNDLNGYPVRICMFPTRLKAIKQPDGTYKGTDGIIVSTLAKHMNFKPVYSEPSDGRKYGWAELNSNYNFKYTGLLGDLVHNKVDMAFNGVFLDV